MGFKPIPRPVPVWIRGDQVEYSTRTGREGLCEVCGEPAYVKEVLPPEQDAELMLCCPCAEAMPDDWISAWFVKVLVNHRRVPQLPLPPPPAKVSE